MQALIDFPVNGYRQILVLKRNPLDESENGTLQGIALEGAMSLVSKRTLFDLKPLVVVQIENRKGSGFSFSAHG